MRRYAVRLGALALVAALAGCSDDGSEPDSEQEPESSTEPSSSETQPLDWQPTGESPEATVVVGRTARAVVPPGGDRVVLTLADEEVRVPAGRGYRIDQVLMDDDRAVVVAQDEAEERPAKGTLVDLATGESGPVPGPRPETGGSWAMHGGELRLPARGPGGAYCLFVVDLSGGDSAPEHCAEEGEGFARVTSSAHGTAMMTFDDARPVSCRTLVLLTDSTPTPVDGVPECRGWDVAATATGAVWSVVEDEQQVQQGDFHATHDGEVVPLGVGATGTLVPCGDSVFFARNASGGDPARLLRWVDGRLEVAYESPGSGEGFLSAPACADGVLTLTLLSEDGDEQVWAEVPGSG